MMSKELSNNNKTRIMVFGTFDVIHKGHQHMFSQARALAANPFLIVSVARDKNVERIKGAAPLRSENQRLADVKVDKLVDEAVLGALGDHMPHIIEEKPDIIALGYDQMAYTQGLGQALAKHGLHARIIRLQPYQTEKYKSSIIKKIMLDKNPSSKSKPININKI